MRKIMSIFSIRSRIGLGLLLVPILMVLLAYTPAHALVDCATAGDTDADMDGYTDLEECTGLVLNDGTSISSCSAGGPRSDCLDPDTPDLFVILVPASPSNFPANPLELVSRPEAEGGLGIMTHQIDAAAADAYRKVTPTQKAVRVTEDLNTVGELLGVANYGTPNGLDLAKIYSQRIINHVTDVYSGAGQTPPAGLIDTYIRHTLAHEIGHMLALAPDYNRRFGGNHFKAGSNVIMEQNVKYTQKGSKITFYISDMYSDPSKAAMILR